MAVTKIWDIITTYITLSIQEDNPQYLPKIEEELKPAFELIKYSGRLDCEEQIAKTMTYIIVHSKQISEIMW